MDNNGNQQQQYQQPQPQYQQPQYQQPQPQYQQPQYQQQQYQQPVQPGYRPVPPIPTGESCPRCGGMGKKKYKTWQILVAIFFFPIGLLALCVSKENKCTVCGNWF